LPDRSSSSALATLITGIPATSDGNAPADGTGETVAEGEALTLMDGDVVAPADGEEHAPRREAMSSARMPMRAMPSLAMSRCRCRNTRWTSGPDDWFRETPIGHRL
jgi:hypothetical protein